MNFTRSAVYEWWSDVSGEDGMPIGPVPYLKFGAELGENIGPGRWWKHLTVETDHGGEHYALKCSLVRDALNDPGLEERMFRALERKLGRAIPVAETMAAGNVY